MSQETPDKVEPYLAKMGVTLKTAAKSKASGNYGIKGIPACVLIDPEGKVVYAGHPSGVSKGKVKEALKGARRPGKQAMLAFEPRASYSKPLHGIVDDSRDGNLSKAIRSVDAMAEDSEIDAGVREEATALAGELHGFVKTLRGQVENLIEQRNVAPAIDAYKLLAKALKQIDAGAEIAKRLDEIEDDKELMNELAASKALQKAHDMAERRGKSKAEKKYKAVKKKYPGTRAAERAGNILRSS